MYKIGGILFMILQGFLCAQFGWIALLWCPLGFMFGIFSTSNIVLPILIGFPLATSLILKKQMRAGVYLALLRAPVIWFIILFLIGFFFPSAATWIWNNQPLNIAANLGFLLILLSPISKKVRDDFRADFDKAWGKYYTDYIPTNEDLNIQNAITKNINYSAKEMKQQKPTDEKASKRLVENGKLKVSAKNYQGAIDDFTEAIDLDPNSYDGYLERSKVKELLNDDKGAKSDKNIAIVLIEKLEAGLKAYDDGIAKYDADDFKSAIEFFTKSASLIDISDNYYYRGLSKKYLDDFQGAIIDLTKTIEKRPDFANAYYQRGKIKFHELKDKEGAIADYTKAIELNPEDDEIYASRARVKSDFSKEEAIKDYTIAVELNPSNSQAFFSRATEKFGLRDYKGAIDDLDIVVKLGLPDNSNISMTDVYSFRGGFKNLSHDYEGAISDFTMLIKLAPTSAKAFFERAEAKVSLEKFNEAVEDYNRAIELDPSDGENFYRRANARLELGQDDLAFEDKITAIKLGYEE